MTFDSSVERRSILPRCRREPGTVVVSVVLAAAACVCVVDVWVAHKMGGVWHVSMPPRDNR